MCGIVYAQNFKGEPVNNEVLQRFDKQRSRGTEGFGLFDGDKMNLVRATKENKILNWLVKYNSSTILFHHRWPSSTVNVKRAAHPFTTKDYFKDTQYILVHNGHLTNSEDLYTKHQELGITYRSLLSDLSFNDSEALCWDFALAMEQKTKTLTTKGSVAFICLRTHKGKLDKLYFGRNYLNPLKMLKSKDGLILSSEGDGTMIDDDTLYTWNYKTKRLSKRAFTIPTGYETPAYTGGYSPPTHWEYTDDTDPVTPENLSWFKKTQQKLLGTDNQMTLLEPKQFQTQEFILESMESYVPRADEVQTIALDYLNVAGGHFESAHYALETDYIDLESQAMFLRDYMYLRKLEMAQAFLENDPEYLNEHSVSSIWKGEELYV